MAKDADPDSEDMILEPKSMGFTATTNLSPTRCWGGAVGRFALKSAVTLGMLVVLCLSFCYSHPLGFNL